MAKMCTLSELRSQFGQMGWPQDKQCPTKYQAQSQSNYKIEVNSSYASNQLFPVDAASWKMNTNTIQVGYSSLYSQLGGSVSFQYNLNTKPTTSNAETFWTVEQMYDNYFGSGSMSYSQSPASTTVDIPQSPTYFIIVINFVYTTEQKQYNYEPNSAATVKIGSRSYQISTVRSTFHGYDLNALKVGIGFQAGTNGYGSTTMTFSHGYTNWDGIYFWYPDEGQNITINLSGQIVPEYDY